MYEESLRCCKHLVYTSTNAHIKYLSHTYMHKHILPIPKLILFIYSKFQNRNIFHFQNVSLYRGKINLFLREVLSTRDKL